MTIAKEQKIKKLVMFSQNEWDYIQNYKHANKLKTDNDVIKDIILKDKQKQNDIIMKSIERNSEILKDLADK